MRLPGIVIAVALGAAVLAGCGGHGDSGTNRIRGRTLSIYTSLPLQGPSRPTAQSVFAGEELALEQAHGRIGKYTIALKPLDDSTRQREEWDPGQTTLNARRAVQDPSTVGYIGDVDSGATAVSIPLLNRLEIPQISAGSSAVGLTSAAAGAAPGEPEKYYPTGIRTFARVVPNDTVQAAVQVKLQQSMGCQKTYVLDDGEVDGEDLADTFQLHARAAGLEVLAVQDFPNKATTYAPLAHSVAQTGADCVLISGLTASGAPRLVTQIAAALPGARIFGSAAMAESTFTDPRRGGIPLALDPRVLITGPPPSVAPAARAFYSAYQERYGAAAPYAIYGYEAMSLMLSVIASASDNGRHSVLRSAVLDALFDTHDRHSVLGTYSITPSGDMTLDRYGVYRVVDGKLRYLTSLPG